MPTQKFNVIQDMISHEELVEEVAKMQKIIRYLLNGNLDSENTREIGGWLVSQTELASKDNDVGMSTEDTVSDDVRFWAGSATKDTAPWRVHKSGVMYSTGGVFRSAAGYPRVELNSINNLIAAYADPDTYAAFVPIGIGNVPTLIMVDAGSTKGFLQRAVGGTTLGTFDSEALTFQAAGNLVLNPTGSLVIGSSAGNSGSFFVSATSGGPADVLVSFTKGIRTS